MPGASGARRPHCDVSDACAGLDVLHVVQHSSAMFIVTSALERMVSFPVGSRSRIQTRSAWDMTPVQASWSMHGQMSFAIIEQIASLALTLAQHGQGTSVKTQFELRSASASCQLAVPVARGVCGGGRCEYSHRRASLPARCGSAFSGCSLISECFLCTGM